LACFLAACSAATAAEKTVSCAINDAPIRMALQVLWSAGAPAGVVYEVADNVSAETRVNLSFKNMAFGAAVDAFCDSVGLKYEVRGNTYYFENAEKRPLIVIVPRGDRLSWKLRNAEPLEVATQLLDAFAKKSDVDAGASPDEELTALARRYAEQITAIAAMAPAEQAPRLKDLRQEAARYIKPPKPIAPGTAKALSVESAQLSFGDAMDTLAEAAGFLWFRHDDGTIVIRDTASADRVRGIFQQEKVWDALQK